MCKIHDKTDLTEYTGYKAVLKIGNKFYSPCTGLEYKVGMKLPNMRKRRPIPVDSDIKWCNVLDKKSVYYNKLMQGKTGVFQTLRGCKLGVVQLGGYIAIKMTIGGEIYKGKYCGFGTRIGSEIINMEEI
jgi:hypothetical protein